MVVERLPYSSFKSFSRLFATYAGDFDRVASFFAGDFRDPRQRGQIAMQVADQYEFRNELIDVLQDQNRTFGAGTAARKNIELLAESEAVAVVTGQQLGLFTGPLYTLYKTITAVKLARRLAEDTGRPVVPVFWLEGEDHDVDEVSSARFYAGNRIESIAYEAIANEPDAGPGPVGRIVFDGGIAGAVDRLGEILPPTDFHDGLMDTVRKAYRTGHTFMDAFVRMMTSFFGETGLVFISGDDVRLKRLALPLFRKELKEHVRSARLLAGVSAKLAENYHIQVRTEPTNLFRMNGSGRRSLVAEADGFKLKGSEKTYRLDELKEELETHPESFSPNVVLRPLFQDSVLPTAAYVAGPGEVAYLSQFKPLYEWAGIPMPIVYPRASLTLVEPKIQKMLSKFDAAVQDFEEQTDKMFHALVLDAMDIDADAIFTRAGRHIHDAVNTVAPAIEAVDASLRQAGEAARTALFREWHRLRDRVVKAEKRRHEQTRAQIEKTRTHLFPDGGLQERLISPLYFLNKYGPDLVKNLSESTDLDTTEHQIVSL